MKPGLHSFASMVARCSTFLCLLVACLPMSSTTFAATDLRTSFILEQAYGELLSADSQTDFLKAAHTYEKLLAEGHVNGPILYHTGTAYLLAGRQAEALDYLNRAEQHLGSTWEIDRNRELALQTVNAQASTVDVKRALFFWHYNVGYTTRLWVTVIAFMVVWFILILRVLDVRSLTGVSLTLAWLLVIAFGSSVVTTILTDRDALHHAAELAESNTTP